MVRARRGIAAESPTPPSWGGIEYPVDRRRLKTFTGKALSQPQTPVAPRTPIYSPEA